MIIDKDKNQTQTNNGKKFLNILINRLVVMMIMIIIILPARYYTSYSLTANKAAANLAVNYLNVVDFAVFFLMVICIAIYRKRTISQINLSIVSIFLIMSTIDAIGLYITENFIYFTEIISKFNILLGAIILAEVVHYRIDDIFVIVIYIMSLAILVMAPFFLSGYASYATSNRVGTLGFGSNEAAMFACSLIAISLLLKLNYWVKCIIIALSMASILTVSSRRGIVVALAILALFVFSWLLKRKGNLTVKYLASITTAIVVFPILVFHYRDEIRNYINNTPLILRFNYQNAIGEPIFDVSDRKKIFLKGFGLLSGKPVFGYYGCDKLFAQGQLTHNHNLLLQMLVVHGIFWGSIVCFYFLLTLARSIYLIIFQLNNDTMQFGASIVSVFYIIYFGFDMFGYLLWNPKGLFWVLFSSALINEEYSKLREIIICGVCLDNTNIKV